MQSYALPLINVAAAVWVGAIVFQSFFVAPTLFQHVGGAEASRFLRAIFPRFYWLGLGCGALMIVGALAANAARGGPAEGWLLPAILTMTVAEALSLALVPRINAARDEGAQGRFKRLHALSVGLTLLVLAIGVAVLVAIAGGA